MKRYYKTYVEPILNGIGDDARAELAKNNLAQSFIATIRSPKFALMNKAGKETAISNFYWCIVQLYTNTRFMNPTDGFGNKYYIPNDKSKYTDIYAKLDRNTGDFDIPKKYHGIFQIVHNPIMGYVCRMRRRDKYPFYIIAPRGVRDELRNALNQATQLPMCNIDDMLRLWTFILNNSQIKSTAPKAPKENSRGHLAIAQEIWDETNTAGRYTKIQNQINRIINDADKKVQSEALLLKAARYEQYSAINNARIAYDIEEPDDESVWNATKAVMESTIKCQKAVCVINHVQADKKQSIENLKMRSGLPFDKLRDRQR